MEATMTQLTKLFEPGKIGKLEIKNRIYMAPMVSRTADDKGYVTQRMINYYVARAKGGVGVISCQSSCILYESRAPRRLFVYDDKFIPGLQELTTAVHEHGAKVVLEVAHWGMLMTGQLTGVDDPEAMKVIAPSAIPFGPTHFVPKEATQEDIDRLVAGFAEAARRIRDAGFDAVEIHGAHGRLIGQFLSPLWNKRRDKYGGSLENRARFACEVTSAIRRKVGPDFPVIFRLSGSDFMEGSTTLEHTLVHAPMFVEAGADALHVSASTPGSYHWQFPCYMFPDGNLVHLSAAIKKVVNVPVIAVGKIGDPIFAESVLQQGKADFVAMGRALLADPELPNKAKQGKFDEIRYCIYCNNCLQWTESELRKHIRCTVNPYLCRETESELQPATIRKKVMVVGGGLAGMEAARVLAERGHSVYLYEKDSQLGGQWNAASAPERDASGKFANLTKQMTRGLHDAKVNITLNKKVTSQLVREAKPDAVVVATGAKPKIPNVPGIQGRNTVVASEVFLGKAKVGNRVVVIGGSYTGLEVALFLAEQGKRVAVVDQIELGKGVQYEVFLTLRERLIENGIQFFRYSPLVQILDNGVYINFQNELLWLKADTVVLAVGVEPVNELLPELEKLVGEIHIIGDAASPRDGREAIQEGAEVGRKI